MPENDYTRIFGKIERIFEVHTVNGQVTSTTFRMKLLDEAIGNISLDVDGRYYEFPGMIPSGYVGQEAMYFDYYDNRGRSTSIQVGKITRRNHEGPPNYDVKEDPNLDPSIPGKISGKWCK